MNTTRLAALIGCGLLLAAAGHASAQAQESPSLYPSRPVTFIVPFAPGGVTTVIARLIGQKLEQRLGKPFVVENRPGGGGVIGGDRGRARGARRLHHHDGVEHRARDQRQRAQEPALRSAQGPHADRADGARAVRAGGQSRPAGALGRRSGQACQGEARPDHVRHARARHVPSSQRRDCSRAFRPRPRARALQGLGAGAAPTWSAATSR